MLTCLIFLSGLFWVVWHGSHRHWIYIGFGIVAGLLMATFALGLVGYFKTRNNKDDPDGLTILSLSSTSQVLLTERTFREYTEDIFHSVLWRWRYNRRFGSFPYDITPYCSQCELAHGIKQKLENSYGGLKCSFCLGLYSPPSASISDEIQAKIKDGSWLEVVNNRRSK